MQSNPSAASLATRLNEVQLALIDAWKSLAGREYEARDGEDSFLARLGRSFCKYPPMILLSAGKETQAAWLELGTRLDERSIPLHHFTTLVAGRLDVTHLALNAPVPAAIADKQGRETGFKSVEVNLIRSPVNLQPLHGDFGPMLAAFPEHKPSTEDFDGALWVHTRQNGIFQTWSPRYTMFSAGNVTEKARLITLGSVSGSVAAGRETGQGSAAVDLFSGIGYFAFSYLKAGVSQVLCWDLNPWSIEGLRRGAVANKWIVSVFEDLPMQERPPAESQILAFRESNENARERIRLMQTTLSPIRHVNCGMLPSVGSAWQTAVDIVDTNLGGWLHLHESVLIRSLKERTEEILDRMRTYVLDEDRRSSQEVRLEHVEKVKNAGPGLIHIVLDIWIPPVTRLTA